MPKLTLSEDHIYTLDGRRLIGVTEALLILDTRWKVDPYYLDRGRAIHLACEYHDKGTLEPASVHLDYLGYFNAYLKFLTDTRPEIIHIEKRLYHPRFFYGGKLDRVIKLNGDLILIDLKSGGKVPVDELQGAAYWELCKANNIPVKKVFDLYLREDGTYKLEPIKNPKLLLPIFLACLKITVWREKL